MRIFRRKLLRSAAAYAPDKPRAICPRCWSSLDLDYGKGRHPMERGRRGWGVSRRDAANLVGDSDEALVGGLYRCANLDCNTVVELVTRLAGGYVPALVRLHQLTATEAAAYAAGRPDAGGIWRDRNGDARTAPRQRDLFG
ncbi:MAG TPA: hypothetical protein VFY16_09565 [Gemmatimonadaceae bacterium]|nr:hypothetical protein [Gemmatimonadaceae bacterium]